MTTVRAFIAVDLPVSVKKTIADLQTELKRSPSDVKWVRPANCHITVKFLGDISNDQAESVGRVLEECAAGCSAFPLIVDSVGAFPKIERPNIIWLGLADEKNQLARIAGEIEGKLLKLGFIQEDRPFAPHITIGRTRPGSHKALSEALKTIAVPAGLAFEAKAITLFKSDLPSEGPVYSVLKEYPFTV
jgi:2'-5' RNA ligase